MDIDEMNRLLYPNGRDEAWRKLSEMAGLDEDGNVLPPPIDFAIDRSPTPWWKNRAR